MTQRRQTVRTRVAQGGRIVIPVEMRKQLGIEIGDDVNLIVEDESLTISTRASAIRHIHRIVENSGVRRGTIVDEFMAERRKEAEDE